MCIFNQEMWGLKHTRPAMNLFLRESFALDIETVFFPVFKHNRPLRELFNAVGASSMGATTPRVQNGNPVDTEMYAIGRVEWERRNPVGF
jgi:hypothetical protein